MLVLYYNLKHFVVKASNDASKAFYFLFFFLLGLIIFKWTVNSIVIPKMEA